MFESSGAVDFSRAGAHLIQDIELVLVTSTLVARIFLFQLAYCHSEVHRRDLSVPTGQKLKDCIMDEDVLILGNEIEKKKRLIILQKLST